MKAVNFIERDGYRVWMDNKIGQTQFWSWERTDGTGCAGNYRSQEQAEERAKASLARRPHGTNDPISI
jgi:hypothetical protein